MRLDDNLALRATVEAGATLAADIHIARVALQALVVETAGTPLERLAVVAALALSGSSNEVVGMCGSIETVLIRSTVRSD